MTRELVFAVLMSVTRDGAYSHVALKEVLDKYQYLDKRERSFITRVCMGTLEQMIYLDYVIEAFSSMPVAKMKPAIRTILRSGTYELRFMDSIPDRATCDEAVKLAQKKGFGNLKGFVNGILRNISRNPQKPALPERAADECAYLSLRYSMPRWLVEGWLARFGTKRTEGMLAAFLSSPPLHVRVNTARTTREELIGCLASEGVTAQPLAEVPDGLSISGYDYLDGIASFREGLFSVQDASSMRLGHACGIKPGDRVIDVCAAPGGKSIHLAELLGGSGHVEARDISPQKVALLQENIARSKLLNIEAAQADARVLREGDISSADLVLADLPCSGLGTIGKKPDIKYRVTKERIGELCALQREILSVACQYVKPGGTLMYSTCTVCEQENEGNVRWFLQEYPEYRLGFQEQRLPKEGEQDGFFMAKLVKK